MKVNSILLRVVPVALVLMSAETAHGQNTSTLPLKVGPADSAATAQKFSYRALGLVGSTDASPLSRTVRSGAPINAATVPSIPGPGFYPADVTNPGNNPAIETTEHHPIYVNRSPSHWGNVSGFLTDLGQSEFIHVLDQYVGSTASNRYTMGTSFIAEGYPIPANHTLQISDILALVHAGASVAGNGFGNLYHIFLPKGVDMCLSATDCYSPDNSSTFYFCAFHGSVTFTDAVGHAVFTVEPYQDVSGCSVPPTGTANSQLIDSTNNVLSHETSEAISDPDLDAWWVQNLTFASGNEIGDLCIRSIQVGSNYYWDYGNVKLNGHLYTFQPEYSDQVHGCTYSPVGLE